MTVLITGYLKYTTPIKDLIKQSDARLWANINSYSGHPLACLLPNKRNRILRESEHPYIIPKIKTDRFKIISLNRCLFNCKK